MRAIETTGEKDLVGLLDVEQARSPVKKQRRTSRDRLERHVLIPGTLLAILGTCFLNAAQLSAPAMTTPTSPGRENPAPTASVRIESLEREVKANNEALESVRRNQIDYRVERDILKDVYSSNLETINIVITIVLGVLAVLTFLGGFLGVKSIAGVRDDFRRELDKLEALRGRFETKFLEVEKEQEAAKATFAELANVNEEQNKRLRILELQEKVSALAKQGNFARALEYLSVGLELSPGDPVLLRQRVNCLSGLQRFSEAIDTAKTILESDPREPTALANIMELYLITSDLPAFDQLFVVNRNLIAENNPYVVWYLESLRAFRGGDGPKLRSLMREHLGPGIPEKVPLLGGWRYAEVRHVLSALPASSDRTLVFKFIDLLEGKLSTGELRQAVSSQA